MKRTFHKLTALGLAFLIALGMTFTAFAAGNDDAAPANQADITITGTGKAYVAYRLLDLTTSLKTDPTAHEDDDDGHSKDCWNYSYTVNGTYRADIISALKNANLTDKNTLTDTEILDILEGLTDRGDDIRKFADEVYKLVKNKNPDETATVTSATKVFTDVPQGYYLIVESQTDDDPDSRSLVMLDTAGQEDVTVTSKESVPELTKEIEETDDTDNSSAWQDAGDFDIGDHVKFRLTGTLPENIDAYTTYTYIFHDTLSAGLQLDNDTTEYPIVVKADENTLTKGTDYQIIVPGTESTGNKCTFEVKILNVKGLITAGKLAKTGKITVEYTAELLDSANTGAPGNDNKAHLEFSNDPYNSDSTSDTPDDRVIGFTFKLVVNKIDKDKKPLTGANFKLQKFIDGEWKDYKTITLTGDQSTFTFNGLDSGKYKLVETKIPDGYNKADDIEFEVVATYVEEGENDELVLQKLEIKDAEGNVISGDTDSDAEFIVTLSDGGITTAVVNSTGVHLPTTGGAGTYLIYALGIITLIGGGTLYVRSKKKNKA